MQMIDFHTHILPGIDDGSRNIEETAAMLQAEKEQGVDTVIATPHFYAEHTNVSHFLEKRANALELTEAYRAEHPDLPGVKAAAEVYYFPGMGDARQVEDLTLEGTDVLLVEMPFAQWTKQMYKDISELAVHRKFRVVLVHLERFYAFQKDRRVWEQILSLPITVQVNTGALSGNIFKRRTAFHMLNLGLPVILGSDCHNTTSRPPNLISGMDRIRKKAGQGLVDDCSRNAENLLKMCTKNV